MNQALPRLAFVLSSLLAFTAACSDDNGNTTTSSSTGTGTGTGGAGGAGSGGAGGATSSSSGTGGTPVVCEGPGFTGNEMAVPITSVQATIVDFGTPPMPVANVLTFLCGTDICSDPGSTGVNGQVFIDAPDPPGVMKLPAFKYGDGLEHGKFAVRVPDAINVLPTTAIATLPPLAEGKTLEPGTTVTSGDVTLTIPAETTVEIDYLFYDEAEKEGFRTTTITDPAAVIAIDPALNLEIAYAVAPVETLFCPAVMVTVPNTLGWTAGAEVEFFVHGVDVAQHWAPYGGWAKMSDGRVSADGATISTSPEGGMSILSVFGIRLK